jgi:hypothetical protein
MQPIYANGAGLPAFFKVNGKLSISNPLQTFGITASSFLIPQDYAPENYVINNPISFEIDESPLQTVIPPDILKNTTYDWDYGDGAKATGLKNSHAYSKIGSYILTLTINLHTSDPSAPTQFIDSYLINIIPEKGYSGFPQAVIKVNGTQIADPLKNIKDVNFSEPVALDALDSKSIAPITEYLWNFGDGETSIQPTVTHSYANQYFETVVLRIKNIDGFISDAFVGLRNNSNVPPNTQSPAGIKAGISKNPLPYILGALLIISAVCTFILLIARKKR